VQQTHTEAHGRNHQPGQESDQSGQRDQPEFARPYQRAQRLRHFDGGD
jgi:hypothetical protein